MANICSWNIRGCNHPNKQTEIVAFCSRFNVGFWGILKAESGGSTIEACEKRLGTGCFT